MFNFLGVLSISILFNFLGVLSMSILSRDPDLFREPPLKPRENGSSFWKERWLKRMVGINPWKLGGSEPAIWFRSLDLFSVKWLDFRISPTSYTLSGGSEDSPVSIVV